MKTLHLFILALFTGASLAIAEKPATATPQNMLLIITDQQTVDALSCAGNQHVKTPNLDRLAARGIRFEKSYCTYTEESAAVPLFVVPPGGKAGVDNQHLVSGLDVMPTLLDYAGIAAPASLQGKSLRPLVEGKEVPWREFVVSEVTGESGTL